MRRIVIAIGTTLTGLALLFAWPTSLNRTTSTASAGDAGTAATPSGTSTSSGTGTGSATTAPSTATTTFDGAAASTRFGDVQVRITVSNGAVTAAEAIAFPSQDHKSQQINAFAVPTLNQEAVSAQSASIAMVSGATITSGAYLESLQSALDQAGL